MGQDGAKIPVMEFIEDINAFMDKEGRSAETALQKLHEQYNGYRRMEQQVQARKLKLRIKLPDIEKTLGVVKRIKQAQADNEAEINTHYELSDGVYARATVPVEQDQVVHLWLGANVMVEFTLDEALELLEHNLQAAKAAIEEQAESIAFLKDQITTSEVNIARVYNWDVRERRKAKEAGGTVD
mmetsp:Transcript_11938/g.40647  ORF Transcript_11938/g.40647 Transcript_11938/m.40647 type:complete len:184 (-) Transcript_11938:311-862(-)